MDRTTARLAAQLDASDKLANMAAMRKAARAMVRDMRTRMANVEASCGLPFADAPERLAAWAIGHDVTVAVHPITGDAELRLHTPTGSGHYVTSLAQTHTAAHAGFLRGYLMRWFDREWSATAPRRAAA